MPERLAPGLHHILDLLACPACAGALAIEPHGIACSACRRLYPLVDGIPVLLVSSATSELDAQAHRE